MVACSLDDVDTPTSPSESPAFSLEELPEQEIFGDPLMLGIARAMPTFAGFYFDEEGRLEVALTEATAYEEAVERIRQVLPARHAGVVFTSRVVQYPFIELARYRTFLRDRIFQIPDVVSLGVRESANRVNVAVATPEAREAVESLLDTSGIPREAVVFDEGITISTLSHDLDDQEPSGEIQGGWRVDFWSASYCTLGFPAIRRSNADSVFIVNSHCTDVERSLDGNWAGQGSLYDSIGYEVLDPAGYSCGFFICTAADAAMFTATVPIDLGRVARTTTPSGCDYCNAGTVVDHTYPTIALPDRWEHTIENETLHKVGRTTGWTYGAVEDTCDDSNGPWVRVCTDRVDFSVKPGDSGSPVFDYYGGTGGSGELRGIVWGSWSNGLGDHDGLMSDLYQIELHLGELVPRNA